VALSGILNAVAPIVTQIINWLSKIITYISAFIAMLSGKNTITVAKKQNESYAKSLDKTAKAANKAQLALAGFDELNNLTTQKDSGGSGGTSPSSMFEEKEIGSILPELIRNWFGKLKTAIQSGDWYSVGAIIAEGLNAAVSKAHDTIKKINFKQIGASIATSINGAIHTIDWHKLGNTLSDGIGGLLDAIIEMLSTLDWESLGSSIAEFITAIDWEGITQRIAEGAGLLIGGVLKSIWGIVKTAIANEALGWAGEDGKLTAEEFIKGFVETWINIKLWNFKNIAVPLGKKLAESLFGINEEMIKAGIDAINGFFSGILSKSDFGKWIKDNIYTPFITWFKKLFGIASPSIVMEEQGRYVAEGLLNGITDKLKNIAAWVQNNIFMPVMNAVKKAFGVAGNVASRFLEIGSALVAGVKNGISNAWGAFSSWVERQFSSIITGAKKLFGIHSPSKVFARIGEFIMRGLYVGIDGEKDTALKSVADIASTMEDT
ncbi:MAG TPA: hypothetical protein VFC74_03070, partial [Oscillospiraceae bacterium]|nr:hypothetical protein [Oscillospiraceae bacterium]